MVQDAKLFPLQRHVRVHGLDERSAFMLKARHQFGVVQIGAEFPKQLAKALQLNVQMLVLLFDLMRSCNLLGAHPLQFRQDRDFFVVIMLWHPFHEPLARTNHLLQDIGLMSGPTSSSTRASSSKILPSC